MPLDFDGVDDDIRAAMPTAGFDFESASQDFTIAYWSIFSNTGDEVTGFGDANNDGWRWIQQQNAGFFRAYFSFDAIDFSITGTQVAMDTTNWHHHALTVKRKGNATYYVDGVNEGTTDVSNGGAGYGLAVAETDFSIGSTRNFFSSWGALRMADFRIYNGVLTAEEIANLASSRIGQGNPIHGRTHVMHGADFDGVDGYVSVPDNNLWTPSAFTASAWFHWDAISGTGSEGIFAHYDGNVGNQRSWCIAIRLSDSKIVCPLSSTGSYQSANDVISTATISTGRWYHVVLRWDGTGSSGGTTLYIDGVLDKTSTASPSSLHNSTETLRIGNQFNTGDANAFFNGKITDARFYNRALSASEITSLYRSGPGAQVVTDPVGWWKLDDVAPGSAITTGGSNNYTDSSGNGNHGTGTDGTGGSNSFKEDFKPVELVGYWPLDDKKVGETCVQFDGTNDYVSMGDQSIFTFGNGSSDSPFSFSHWFRTSATSNSGMVAKGTAAGAGEWYSFINGTSGKVVVRCVDNSTGGYIGREGPTSYLDGVWHHLVGVYSGSGASSGIKVYVDGSQVDNADANSGSYTAMEDTAAALEVGQRGGSKFTGNIADVRLYNRALSAAEITQLYNSGINSGVVADPVGWWRLDDLGNGGDLNTATMKDISGNGNNGTGAAEGSGAEGKWIPMGGRRFMDRSGQANHGTGNDADNSGNQPAVNTLLTGA